MKNMFSTLPLPRMRRPPGPIILKTSKQSDLDSAICRPPREARGVLISSTRRYLIIFAGFAVTRAGVAFRPRPRSGRAGGSPSPQGLSTLACAWRRNGMNKGDGRKSMARNPVVRARDPAAGLDYIVPPARDVLIAARTMGEPDLPLAFCAGPPGDAVNGESRS